MTGTGPFRRIATAAAYGGGGLTLLGLATYGLLLAEAVLARKTVGSPHGLDGPYADGVYGTVYSTPGNAEPIRLAMLGDSLAVGLGMIDASNTPAVRIAHGLAAVAERPVHLTNVAKSGSVSADLAEQVDLALRARPEIAVIFIGANDVTTQQKTPLAVSGLRQAVRRLRDGGVEVVVGTCPDLSTVEPIAQPLRWLTRRWSRALAAAQTMAVVEAGGRTVAFADLLGPEFRTYPREMFGPDRFHPSARGYLQAAYVVLPSVCAALGLWPESDTQPDPERGEGVLPLYLAASEAAKEPGSEVAATRLGGRAIGPRGRWAMLLRRGRGAEGPVDQDDPEVMPRGA
ncbi:SGNH/GDSL hydrolase family protein [Rhizohabitans arisaemae]|uniref:SGNH/GDSL hydrolase family protein n=1 Tax=Rhizohabitans arisaemae TaxID=2720610 RepID=UPI0024B0976A|nr:SGNH/GDSL hydrolase family protein [Rhizohabitans arisaemae]